MSKKKVDNPSCFIVKADDWAGFYIDGKLALQDHHIRLDDVLELLGVNVSSKWADQAWLEQLGSLPTDLKEVKFNES